LISQKYLGVAPTGYFGALTYQALVQYQYSRGLPASGSTDAATRASIQSVSCGNGYGYNYGYNNNYNNYYGTPVLTSLSATSGAVGTSVTIYGSGFDAYNNTINFGGKIITGIPSYQGTAVAFTVPQVNTQAFMYYGYNGSGTYSVTVTTSRGTSNSLSFNVTSGNNNCYVGGYGYSYNPDYNYGYNYNNCYNPGSISISNVTGPTTLTTGSQGVWSLSLYNPNSNYVSVSARWGDEGLYGYNYAATAAQSSYAQGQQTISFSHTYQTSGYYTVVFTATDNNGAQTTASATVNVSGSTYNQGQPNLSSISPNSGRVGTQVILYGSNFALYGSNTVHFGNGGTANLSSANGTTIYYTIPSAISGCDLVSGSGIACAMYAQMVTPGTYPVYVSDGYGQSGTLYFTVTY
jgi:hypothetical protein